MMALKQLQCSIFSTTFNPTSARTGAKYLKGRLRGQAMVDYYPREMTFRELNHTYPGLDIQDADELQRLADVAGRKARGKGAPPKAKEAGECNFYNSNYMATKENIRNFRSKSSCSKEKTMKTPFIHVLAAVFYTLYNLQYIAFLLFREYVEPLQTE
jgi:small subunit ribosomal protein S33